MKASPKKIGMKQPKIAQKRNKGSLSKSKSKVKRKKKQQTSKSPLKVIKKKEKGKTQSKTASKVLAKASESPTNYHKKNRRKKSKNRDEGISNSIGRRMKDLGDSISSLEAVQAGDFINIQDDDNQDYTDEDDNSRVIQGLKPFSDELDGAKFQQSETNKGNKNQKNLFRLTEQESAPLNDLDDLSNKNTINSDANEGGNRGLNSSGNLVSNPKNMIDDLNNGKQFKTEQENEKLNKNNSDLKKKTVAIPVDKIMNNDNKSNAKKPKKEITKRSNTDNSNSKSPSNNVKREKGAKNNENESENLIFEIDNILKSVGEHNNNMKSSYVPSTPKLATVIYEKSDKSCQTPWKLLTEEESKENVKVIYVKEPQEKSRAIPIGPEYLGSAFPEHHYTRKIKDTGQFNDSFEQWLFEPIIFEGNSTKPKTVRDRKSPKKKEVIREKSNDSKTDSKEGIKKKEITPTYKLLNKHRKVFKDEGAVDLNTSKESLRTPSPSPGKVAYGGGNGNYYDGLDDENNNDNNYLIVKPPGEKQTSKIPPQVNINTGLSKDVPKQRIIVTGPGDFLEDKPKGNQATTGDKVPQIENGKNHNVSPVETEQSKPADIIIDSQQKDVSDPKPLSSVKPNLNETKRYSVEIVANLGLEPVQRMSHSDVEDIGEIDSSSAILKEDKYDANFSNNFNKSKVRTGKEPNDQKKDLSSKNKLKHIQLENSVIPEEKAEDDITGVNVSGNDTQSDKKVNSVQMYEKTNHKPEDDFKSDLISLRDVSENVKVNTNDLINASKSINIPEPKPVKEAEKVKLIPIENIEKEKPKEDEKPSLFKSNPFVQKSLAVKSKLEESPPPVKKPTLEDRNPFKKSPEKLKEEAIPKIEKPVKKVPKIIRENPFAKKTEVAPEIEIIKKGEKTIIKPAVPDKKAEAIPIPVVSNSNACDSPSSDAKKFTDLKKLWK